MTHPLSSLQQAMLIGSIGPDAPDLYVVQTVFEWREKIRVPEFESAWSELAGRHEILRSTFLWRDAPEPYQQVRADGQFQVASHTFPAAELAAKQVALESFLEADRGDCFSLSEAPPWRVTVLHFGDGSTTAVWTFHHILLDGRSHVLLIREVLAIYDGLLAGESSPWEREIAHSLHAEWLARQDFSSGRAYWTEYLDPEKVSTAVPGPLDDARNAVGHSSYDLWLGADLTQAMRAFAQEESVSAGNLLQAGWALVLGWLAGDNDVTFGAIRACRKSGLPEGDKVIGLVINTLPLRVRWKQESSLRSIVRAIASDWNQFRSYENTPLRDICRWIRLPANREMFGSAVSFSSEYLPRAVHGASPVRSERDVWVRQTVPYCAVDGGFDGDNFHITVSAPKRLLERSLGVRLPLYLRNALAAIVRTPDLQVGELCLLEADERSRITTAFNGRWEPFPVAVDWLDAVAEQARARAGRIAVHDAAGSLSWGELEQRSNQLARCLQERGVKQDDLIAVFLPRSAQFIWVCLGIMKASAAYLPIDTRWPEQRIANVLMDAQVRQMVSAPDLMRQVPPPFDNDPIFESELAAFPGTPLEERRILPHQLAYVIYTSGSTGMPKGVEIKQAGLQNLIEDMRSAYGLRAEDRASFVSNTAFDASVHEVWPALSAGASIHIAEPRICADPRAMLDWFAEQRITFTFVSTVMAEALLKLSRGAGELALRFMLTGGDQLRHLPDREIGFQLINEYGPTECTVVASRHYVVPGIDAHRNIPIGRPIRGTRAYVVNRQLQLVPAGVAGELLVGGNGLARGYRGEPAMTAAKFIRSHIAEEAGGVLYRTGDLVRWSADGDLQFMGRMDSQVKLRGFRIELGEVETCLLQHPSVSEAVVVVDNSTAQPRLIALVVVKSSARGDLELSTKLSGHLAKRLPEYMVPSGYVWPERLPLNTSGKYDRKAIEFLALAAPGSPSEAHDETLSEAELKMLRVWEEVLGVSPVKSSDRFLALGATSLSMIQMVCAMEKHFGRTISPAALMNDPRPSDLLRLVEGVARQDSLMLVPLKSSGWKSPLFIIPGAGGGVHWFRELAGTMDPERPVFGLELLSLSDAIQQNFNVTAAAEEITSALMAVPDIESYTLSGYSGGGLVALEVAAQLQQQGKQVGAVILIETYPAENLFEGSAKLWQWARGWLSLPRARRWETLVDRIKWYANHRLVPEVKDSVSRQMNEIKERHVQAFIASPLPSYRGKVVIVSAEDRPLSVAANPWSEWERLLGTKFQVMRVPGDHYTVLMGLNANSLGRCLSRVADEFDRRGATEVAAAENGRVGS